MRKNNKRASNNNRQTNLSVVRLMSNHQFRPAPDPSPVARQFFFERTIAITATIPSTGTYDLLISSVRSGEYKLKSLRVWGLPGPGVLQGIIFDPLSSTGSALQTIQDFGSYSERPRLGYHFDSFIRSRPLTEFPDNKILSLSGAAGDVIIHVSILQQTD